MIESMGSLLGKFHPLLIHFPIVLISLIALISLISFIPKSWSQGLVHALPLLWILTLLSSVGAVVSGLLLYTYGGYEGDLVESHKWAGVILLGLTLLVGFYFRAWRKKGLSELAFSYKLASTLLFMGVIYTSHLGGSLTHGIDFLSFQGANSDMLEEEVKRAYAEGNLKVYPHLIHPLLRTHCMSCHNTNKMKGGLNLENWQLLQAGGKSGKPLFVGGDIGQSELMVRVNLPEEDDEFMPPEGKKPLPTEALILLGWWIEQGADRNHSFVDSLLPENVRAAVQSLMPHIQGVQIEQRKSQQLREKHQARLNRLAERLQVKIEPDPAADSQLFALSLQFPPQHFDDEDLKELMPFHSVFSKISLPGAEITDEGLYLIGQFENLRELFVPKTCLEGEGLAYLSNLSNLELLNLSGTKVNNQHLLHILNIEGLKEVFLFQTPVSPNLVEALNGYKPNLTISLKEGPYF